MSCSKKQFHIKFALLEPLDKKDFQCHHLTQKLIRDMCLISVALVLQKKKPLNAILYIQLWHIAESNWVQYNYRQGNTTCEVSEKGAVQMPIPYIDVSFKYACVWVMALKLRRREAIFLNVSLSTSTQCPTYTQWNRMWDRTLKRCRLTFQTDSRQLILQYPPLKKVTFTTKKQHFLQF